MMLLCKEEQGWEGWDRVRLMSGYGRIGTGKFLIRRGINREKMEKGRK